MVALVKTGIGKPLVTFLAVHQKRVNHYALALAGAGYRAPAPGRLRRCTDWHRRCAAQKITVKG